MKLRSSKHMYQSHNQLHRIKPRHFVISAFYSTHMGSCIRNTSIILWPSLCHFRTLLALTSVTLYLSSGYIFIRYVSFFFSFLVEHFQIEYINLFMKTVFFLYKKMLTKTIAECLFFETAKSNKVQGNLYVLPVLTFRHVLFMCQNSPWKKFTFHRNKIKTAK